jgi:hypothetical protein
VTPVPEMKLDVADAAELAGLLQFLSQWLARRTGGAAQKDLGRVKDHPRPIRPVKDQVRLGSCGRLLCGSCVLSRSFQASVRAGTPYRRRSSSDQRLTRRDSRAAQRNTPCAISDVSAAALASLTSARN